MRGSLNRHTGMTEMNRESSRSHSVFTVRRGSPAYCTLSPIAPKP